MQRRAQVEGARPDGHPPLVQTREIEQLVDQPEQRAGVSAQRGSRLLGFAIAALEFLDHAVDQRQRRLELVADVGEEGQPRAIGLVQTLDAALELGARGLEGGGALGDLQREGRLERFELGDAVLQIGMRLLDALEHLGATRERQPKPPQPFAQHAARPAPSGDRHVDLDVERTGATDDDLGGGVEQHHRHRAEHTPRGLEEGVGGRTIVGKAVDAAQPAGRDRLEARLHETEQEAAHQARHRVVEQAWREQAARELAQEAQPFGRTDRATDLEIALRIVGQRVADGVLDRHEQAVGHPHVRRQYAVPLDALGLETIGDLRPGHPMPLEVVPEDVEGVGVGEPRTGVERHVWPRRLHAPTLAPVAFARHRQPARRQQTRDVFEEIG